jgi:hypothetical protein
MLMIKKVEAIYTLLDGDREPARREWSEDKAFVAELDERYERYEQGVDKGQTWDDLEASIAELKAKRAVK